MKNKNSIVRLFSSVCILSLLSSSINAASYFDGTVKKTNDYATAAWKSIKENPTATIAGLAVTGILLYNAHLLRKLAAAEQLKNQLIQQANQLSANLTQFKAIEQWYETEYRIIVDILNENPALATVYSHLNPDTRPIMSQLRNIDKAYTQVPSYVPRQKELQVSEPTLTPEQQSALQAHRQFTMQQGPKSTISWLSVVQGALKREMTQHPEVYITRLQENIAAINRLISSYSAVAQAAQRAGSEYTMSALVTLKKKLLIIKALVDEQLKNDEKLRNTQRQGQGKKV